MSRVSRIALKLMTYRREALNQSYAEEAMGKFDYKIPFTNLFGKGVYRTVVPLKSPMQKDIEMVVEELRSSSGAKVFDGIDWAKGEAYKFVPLHEKAPPGTQPKVQRTNLGKVLGRLPNSSVYLNWWSANQGVRDENGFSVVISRHPIDVVRMSDFPGDEGDYPDITSCHSPDDTEWSSCVAEMKHGGPIAYLVKNKDLDSLDLKQIAGKGEIFADLDRNIPGIKPLSRLRLRRYTHKGDDFDLALPETTVYGKSSSDFKEQVMDWARTTQAGLIGEHRWRMDEFDRRGGDYSDSGDSALFNRFFQDQLDHGNTDQRSAGKGQEAENERRRNEIERIHNNWAGRLEHCSVYYDEDRGEGDEVRFSWDCVMSVKIPQNQFVGSNFDLDRKESESLIETFSDNSFYNISWLTVDSYGNEVSFRFNIGDEGGNGDPDGYNDFCSTVYSDYDNKYDEIKQVIMGWLYENEHMNPIPARQFVADYEEAIHQFQNFDVEWDSNSGDVTAAASTFIGSTTAMFSMGGRKEDFLRPVVQEIRALVANELQKILARAKLTSGYLPGFGPEPVRREIYNLNLFNVKIISAVSGVKLIIWFEAHDLTTQEEMEEMIDLLNVVDKMFPRIAQDCEAWFQKYVQQYTEYAEKKEEYRNKYNYYENDYKHNYNIEPSFQFDPHRQARQRRRRTTQEIFAP